MTTPPTHPATLPAELVADRIMREFYLSPAYDPKAERHADTVKAAIAFALSAPGIVAMREALSKAMAWFDEYATSHEKQAISTSDVGETIQRLAKAKTNKDRADYLRAALSPKETERGR